MAGNHPNETSPYWSFSSSMESAMDTFECSDFLELDDWCEVEPLSQMITDHPHPSLLQAMNEGSPSEGGVSTSQDGPRNGKKDELIHHSRVEVQPDRSSQSSDLTACPCKMLGLARNIKW
ncbi:unnamed protein product [Cuscuta epithymum]|nr:unnamed protein product [Cuscuta epithymum]